MEVVATEAKAAEAEAAEAEAAEEAVALPPAAWAKWDCSGVGRASARPDPPL